MKKVLDEGEFHKFDVGLFYDYLGVRESANSDLILEDAVTFIRDSMGDSRALQWFCKDAFMRNHKTWDEMDEWIVKDLDKMLERKAVSKGLDQEDIADIKAYLDLDRDDKNFNEFRLEFVDPKQINIDNYFEADDAINKKVRLIQGAIVDRTTDAGELVLRSDSDF